MAVVQWWAEAHCRHVVTADSCQKAINLSRLRLLDVDVFPAETGLPGVVKVHFQPLGAEDRGVEDCTEWCGRLS